MEELIKQKLAKLDDAKSGREVYVKKKQETMNTVLTPEIKEMLKDIEAWMEGKGYKSLKDFRGKLSNKEINDPFIYKRAHYVDLLLKSEELFKKEGLM